MIRGHGASAHARQRLAERYGLELTRDQWREIARAIARAVRDGVAFVELDPFDGRPRYRTRITIVRDDGRAMALPLVFQLSRRGSVSIVTVLPGGRWRPLTDHDLEAVSSFDA